MSARSFALQLMPQRSFLFQVQTLDATILPAIIEVVDIVVLFTKCSSSSRRLMTPRWRRDVPILLTESVMKLLGKYLNRPAML